MNANRKANLIVTALIAVLVVVMLSLGLASCGALGVGNGWVAVDPASLPPETVAHALPTEVPIPNVDPERFYVVVPEADVPEGVAGIDLGEVPTPPSGDDWSGAIGGALGALGPWGALGGALLAKLLASKRGRQNGAQAVRALVAMKPVDAVRSVLAADGWAHTDRPVPKETSKPG